MNVTKAYVDERLQETLSVKKIKVSFDNNSFFSLSLCIALKKNGCMVTTTLRNDWTNNGYCLLKKNWKSERFEYLTDANRQITIIKWFDNKCAQIILNFCRPKTTINAKQWERTRQTYFKIYFLTALQEYNKSMGGVHLADMLIPLYRLTIKTKDYTWKSWFTLSILRRQMHGSCTGAILITARSLRSPSFLCWSSQFQLHCHLQLLKLFKAPGQ